MRPLLVWLCVLAPLPSQAIVVERLAAGHLGSMVSHVHSEPVHQKKSARRSFKRHYCRHVIRIGEPPAQSMAFFSKTGRRPADHRIEHFVGQLDLEAFRIPTFLGIGRSSAGETALWRFIVGRRPTLDDFDRRALLGIARTIGLLNGHADQAVKQIPGLPIATRRANPKAPLIRKSLEDSGVWRPDLEAPVDRFARLEEAALCRLGSIAECVLAHQDIGPANLLLETETRHLYLVDWEMLAIAAPGCDLRWFTALPCEIQKEVAACYGETLEARGRRVAQRDIIFVMNMMRFLRERDALANRVSRGVATGSQTFEGVARLSDTLRAVA